MTAAGFYAENRRFRWFLSLCIALSSALCFVLPSGYSYGPALVFLVGFPWLLVKRPALELSRLDVIMIGALLSCFALNVLLLVVTRHSKYGLTIADVLLA